MYRVKGGVARMKWFRNSTTKRLDRAFDFILLFDIANNKHKLEFKNLEISYAGLKLWAKIKIWYENSVNTKILCLTWVWNCFRYNNVRVCEKGLMLRNKLSTNSSLMIC